jgi:DNA-binding transcriptional MocR family regulator
MGKGVDDEMTRDAIHPPLTLARRMDGAVSSPVRELLALTNRPDVISFAGGLPAAELFDVSGLRAAFAAALSDEQAGRSLQYTVTDGDARLRAMVAARLATRGLTTDAAELLITTGSQQALTLLATALVDPGDVVAVESPTYLAALQALRLAGARIVAVRGDDDGLDPLALAEVVAQHRPRLVYLVPTFANPTGRTLSAARRGDVVRIAREAGTWLIEDDPYSELRYDGVPEVSLAATAADEGAAGVIHLGSFSKIGAPGLRLGWMRAPREVITQLAVVKQAADLHTSTIDQAAAAEYLATGAVEPHIAKLRASYRERRDAMLAALPQILPAGSSWSRPEGGMFVWVRLPGAVDTAVLLQDALRRGVAFVPGAAFFAESPDAATLRLSFTTNTPELIDEGLRRLGETIAG